MYNGILESVLLNNAMTYIDEIGLDMIKSILEENEDIESFTPYEFFVFSDFVKFFKYKKPRPEMTDEDIYLDILLNLNDNQILQKYDDTIILLDNIIRI